MTNSVAGTGSMGPRPDHTPQPTAARAPMILHSHNDQDGALTLATERRGHRPPAGSAQSVFAETRGRAQQTEGPHSAPPSLPSGAATGPAIGSDIPSHITVPLLPVGAALPAPLEVEFADPVASGAGAARTSFGSISTVQTGSSDGRVADASVASLMGSENPSQAGAIDIESQAVQPVSKEPLGATAFSAKIERANLIDAVKTHALMHPMLQLDPATNADFREAFHGLVQAINDTLLSTRVETNDAGETQLVDVESGRDLTGLSRFRDSLTGKFDSMSRDLGTLSEARDAFMSFKARHATGSSTTTDSIQRNVFGSELHAVFARSALQSLLVVGASAGFQAATVTMLQRFFATNPDRIPAPVLEAAREQLGAQAAEADVIKEAVSSLASPGSTYLDENTSSDSAIYAAEAGVGLFRGVAVPMADSMNESDARAAKVKGAIDSVDEAPTPKNWKQRGSEAMASAWGAQIKANLLSGGIAAGISTATTKQTTGPNVLLEVGKTMGFSVIAAANNAAADGFRRAVYDGKSEAVTQSIKAAARVVGRTVAQGLKTGASYAQSAAEGTLQNRSVGGDMLKAGMQSVVSGGLKEILGSVFQNATASHLPPNETAVLAAGKALGTLADFSRQLTSMERPADLSAEGQAKLQDLSYMVSNTLTGVLDGSGIKFESVDFDAAYQVYQSQLLQKISDTNTSSA